MCINCTYRHALVMAGVFSRATGAVADFTLPPTEHAGQTNETGHRRAIGVIGEIIDAIMPSIEVRTRQVPQSVIDAAERDAMERLKAVYNRKFEIEGKTIPGGSVVSHAALAALYYVDLLLFASRHIEEIVRAQARENPEYPGPILMAERFAEKRADLARQLTEPAQFTDGTKSDALDFPPDMPEHVRDVIRRARAAGIPLENIAVLDQSGGHPVGTGPDGKLH